MQEAGFGDAEPAGETGFNSSPVTRGALFRGTRKGGEIRLSIDDSLKKYREFFEAAYAEGAIDRKMKHLIALGASLAAGCEP
jgi:alkylhydroperoxidase/carboxymuconolactone decarboxylase family protein YurZ